MIVTFYSFKGGVGRSMALANIGRWFQMCGLDVVVVDWDLEAPGLESFFLAPGPEADNAREQLGLLDVLNLYRQAHPNLGFDMTREPGQATLKQDPKADLDRLRARLPPMLHTLIDIPAPPANGAGPNRQQPGSLKLMCAGWRGGERFATYANAVQSFDWNDFYASYHGRAYFEWLRESLCQPGVADIVLIDSRTGVTEMGGVCTRQMADVVVVLTAPNRQNIDGATRMADSFRRKEVIDERGGRALELIMVPSRVDVSSSDVKVAFEHDFRANAERFVPYEMQRLQRDFWDLRIPYIAKYAFMEKLAIGEADGDPDIVAAYKAIAAHVAWLAPEESRIKQLMRDEFERVFGVEQTRIYLASDRFFTRAIERLDPGDLKMARRILIRLVTVAQDGAGSRDTPRQVAWDAFDAEHQRVIECLIQFGLVRRAEGKRALIGLCNDDFVTRSELKAWVDDDREFLLWRQKLRGYMDDWEASKRDPAALLQGSLLDAAQRIRAARPSADLFRDEADFIEASVAEVRRVTVETAAQAQQLKEAQATVLAYAPASSGHKLWWGAAVLVVVVALAYVFLSRPSVTPGTTPLPVQVASLLMQELIKQGQAELRGGDSAEAIKTFTLALDIDPASRDALLGRARALKAGNDSKGALADLATVLAQAPNDAEALLERAGTHADSGDAKSALADLDRIAAAGVKTPGVLMKRGKVLEALGNDKAALEAHDDAVKLSDGKNADALFARGEVHERLGQKTLALRDFDAVGKLPVDELTRAAAAARVKRLAPEIPVVVRPAPSKSETIARINVANKGDLKLAEIVKESLGNSGQPAHVNLYSFRPQAPQGIGFVYFYSPADAEQANKIGRLAESALAKAGYKAPMKVLFQAKGSGSGDAIEVLLPPLSSPRSQPN